MFLDRKQLFAPLLQDREGLKNILLLKKDISIGQVFSSIRNF